MAEHKIEELIETAKRKYGSFENPDFSFLNSTFRERPYDSVLNEIDASFHFTNITDTNDDVSFRYQLEKQELKLVLELSALGRFAVILLDLNGQVDLFSPENADSFIRPLVAVLERHRFTFPGKEFLEHPVQANLCNTDRENVRLYQLLFSDVDILPWR